ncbi:MAG: glycoside hydrolase family 2 protein [Candidatus Neomarinimicrobiota bacterium]|nr:glycoside hydrolase family 2 protein [Candidatus Neomarinimicrobiota bacterium]
MKGFRNLLISALSVLLLDCARDQSIPIEIKLDRGWSFRETGTSDWFPAQIPGTVHTDLFTNGIISDPFIGNNEFDLQWIEKRDWEYRLEFNADRKLLRQEIVELEFEGLDTYADVYLNNQLIISADNMFRSWSVPCRKNLKAGKNELRIVFYSPVNRGQNQLERLPYLIPTSNEPKPIGFQTSVHTRKAQYHYGWDWGPRLVTSGVWRPVTLKGWSDVKLRDVFYQLNELTETTAHYTAHLELESTKRQKVELALSILGESWPGVRKTVTVEPGANTFSINFKIENPDLWWPNGFGDQKLYQIKTEIIKEGATLDSEIERIGVRTVALVREPDKHGTSFKFHVNGIPLFMKGANYIPANFFNPRAAQRYEEVIKTAKNAHMNMLRVWGGGVYENNDFYRLCDENGILIWQDFMFACCMVPTGADHHENIRIEAEENVKRLRNRPSVALWCGNNENLTGWNEWDWKRLYSHSDDDSVAIWETYDRLFTETLPAIVEAHDPGKAYWPSSPSSEGNRLQNRFSGDQHEWGVWFGQQPFSHYDRNAGRFISEYGIQALPSLATMRLMDPHHWKDGLSSPVITARQRSRMPWITPDFDGYDMIEHYISLGYQPVKDFESLIYLSQLSQADALKSAAEAHRRNKPITMGSLYWQLIDCWPTVSWSTIDFFGRQKAAHYAIERAYRDVIIASEEKGDSLHVSVISDRLEIFHGKVVIRLRDTRKRVLRADTVSVVATNHRPERMAVYHTKTFLSGLPAEQAVIQIQLLEEEQEIHRNMHLLVKPKELALQKPLIHLSFSLKDRLIELEIESDVFARGVEISTHEIDGTFSDNFFNLYPEELVNIKFVPRKPLGHNLPKFQIQSLYDVAN